MREDQREHLVGYPVNASTYANHDCRCTGCSADNTRRCVEYQQRVDYHLVRRARYVRKPSVLQQFGDPEEWTAPKRNRSKVSTRPDWFEDIREEWD